MCRCTIVYSKLNPAVEPYEAEDMFLYYSEIVKHTALTLLTSTVIRTRRQEPTKANNQYKKILHKKKRRCKHNTNKNSHKC